MREQEMYEPDRDWPPTAEGLGPMVTPKRYQVNSKDYKAFLLTVALLAGIGLFCGAVWLVGYLWGDAGVAVMMGLGVFVFVFTMIRLGLED